MQKLNNNNNDNNNNNNNNINNNTMSVAALPGGMLGARSRLRPLPLSLVGWCASCNNNGVLLLSLNNNNG